MCITTSLVISSTMAFPITIPTSLFWDSKPFFHSWVELIISSSNNCLMLDPSPHCFPHPFIFSHLTCLFSSPDPLKLFPFCSLSWLFSTNSLTQPKRSCFVCCKTLFNMDNGQEEVD
ncbi:hypothetical protein V6Z11_D05G225700 [Gossypium hirsutum]